MNIGKKKYLIYLRSQKDFELEWENAYGFYLGKTYHRNRQLFPHTSMEEDVVLTDGKFYSSKKVAVRVAERLLTRCAYIFSYEIIEFPSDDFSEHAHASPF